MSDSPGNPTDVESDQTRNVVPLNEGSRSQLDDIVVASADQAEREEIMNIPVLDRNGKPRPAREIMADIGDTARLFMSEAGDVYAQVQIGDHREIYNVEERRFGFFLHNHYVDLTGHLCSRGEIADTQNFFLGRAFKNGLVKKARTWVRVAADGDDIVLDRVAEDWSVIRVTRDGWHIERDSDVLFLRSQPMRPYPDTEGVESDFHLLWKYIRVAEELRPLIAGFLLGSLRPNAPCAPLFIAGETGSGKSTFSRILKNLIDPSLAPLRGAPREDRDLLVAACNSWMLVYDNLSYLSPQMADILCQLATGGGMHGRALYTNFGEIVRQFIRPTILNGIEDLASRSDLANRGSHIDLPSLSERQTELEMWSAFNKDWPAIFAGLLDALVVSMRDVRDMPSTRQRMADYVAWAEAGTRAMGFAPGAFTKTYIENQEQGVGDGLESSAAGMALLKLLESRNSWNGSANDLLEALSDHVEEDVRRSKAWPKTPRGMRSVIARLTPALRSNGIGVEYTRTGARGRTITLSHIENDTDSSNNEADFPSSSEEPVHKEPALSVSKLPVDTTEDSFLDGDGGFTV